MKPVPQDQAVEGLRAAAALTVIYAHFTSPGPMLDPGYAPPDLFWRFEAALPAVMIFFLLSGYVIGLTNRGAPSRPALGQYLHRRAVRLLPIYFAAVLFGWLARPGPALADLAGNFLLLQNAAPDSPFHVQLLFGNTNLWSLHYEVIYYLGFLLVWWLRPPLLPLLLVLLLTGALGALLPGFSLWSAWLACGAVFWLLGLSVAWHLPADATARGGPWPSAVLLAVATWRLQIFRAGLVWLGHPVVWLPGITFDYFDTLPVLLWLFLLITRRRPHWLRPLELAAWLLPAAYVVWRNRAGLLPWSDPVMPAAALGLLALVLRGWNPTLGVVERLAPLGAISYGLYAFGAPMQFFVRSLWPAWSGTAWTYGGRCLLALILVFATAWFFERRLQPWFRRRLGPGRTYPGPTGVVRAAHP